MILENRTHVIVLSFPSMENCEPSDIFEEIIESNKYLLLYDNGHNVIWIAVTEVEHTMVALMYGDYIVQTRLVTQFRNLYEKKMRVRMDEGTTVDTLNDAIMVIEFDEWQGNQKISSYNLRPPSWDTWIKKTMPKGHFDQ